MKAFKCDNCGKFFQFDPFIVVTMQNVAGGSEVDYCTTECAILSLKDFKKREDARKEIERKMR